MRRLSVERGTVLVLVLLIVALVAGLSVKFAAQYQLGLARAETRWHGAQARAFLEGTEEVAKLMFPEGDIDDEKDFLGEPWGSEVPIEDEGVSGFAKMTDATAQFNLNDLAGPSIDLTKPDGTPDRYTEPRRRFIRLLQTFPELPLDRNQAEMLLAGVVDWIDADENETGSGGAESNFYQGMKEPYRASNAGLFKSVDELRLVRGFNESPMLVTLLQPYLTVLPVGDAGLNINTLDLVAPYGKGINNLLLCLNSSTELVPMRPEDMAQFFAKRPPEGWTEQTLDADWNAIFAGNPLDKTGLKVKTNYFWLNSTVQLVDQRRSMRSLMMRGTEPGTLSVIRRDDVFELPTVDRGDKDEDGDTELVE